METNTRRILGEKIRRLRTQNKLSQQTFSFMLNIDRGYISEIELGKRNPSIGVIEKIAHGLDVSLAQLFEDVDKPCATQTLESARRQTSK